MSADYESFFDQIKKALQTEATTPASKSEALATLEAMQAKMNELQAMMSGLSVAAYNSNDVLPTYNKRLQKLADGLSSSINMAKMLTDNYKASVAVWMTDPK